MKINFLKICRKIFPNQYILKELKNCKSVLDLGCGHNSIIQNTNISFSVGVELFEPYINESKKKRIHTKYIKEDITKVKFSPKCFDVVIALEVLEHLPKEKSIELINKMTIWAKEKVIITTPNGYCPMHKIDGNILQEHQSEWKADDYKKMGFMVYGTRGLRFFRRASEIFAKIRLLSKFFALLSDLTSRPTYKRPNISFQLLAIKNLIK